MHDLPQPVIYGLLDRHIGLPEDVVRQIQTILCRLALFQAAEEHGLEVAVAQHVYSKRVSYHVKAYFGI